jgi:hypothetical protein
MIKKIRIIFQLAICLLLFFTIGFSVKAAMPDGTVVKGSGPVVYYILNDKRYAFPNKEVYESWYSFYTNIVAVSDENLAPIQLAGNVTFRPGMEMIKLTTDPKVYAIEGKTLRWVSTEDLAEKFYGSEWNKRIFDVSDAFFQNYETGSAITKDTDFDPTAVQNQYGTYASLFNQHQAIYTTIDRPSRIWDYQNGYWAAVNSTPLQVAAWYTANSLDWSKQYAFDEKVTSTDRETIYLNFTKKIGSGFAQRSLIISSINAEDIEASHFPYSVQKGQTNIIYTEVIYPDGYLSYPYSVLTEASPKSILFITDKSKQDIDLWFTKIAPKTGWQISDKKSAEPVFNKMDVYQDDGAIYLKNDTLKKWLSVHQVAEIEDGLTTMFGVTIIDMN